MQIIDPHIHLFDLEQGKYDWLKPEKTPFWSDKTIIAKDFNEQDLILSSPLNLYGFVHIEAGFNNEQPWREVAWLEQHCQKNFRTVAMLDITLSDDEFTNQFDQLLQYQSVVGIRHILDDNALKILTQPQANKNLSVLAKRNISFDVQMPLSDSKAVDKLIEIIIAFPTLMLCINHAGWPPQEREENTRWKFAITRLSQYQNVYIKCSGFEISQRQYSRTWQNEVIQFVVEHFGDGRTMLASNFPLCLFRESYNQTWQQYHNEKLNIDPLLSPLQWQNIFFNTAKKFYKLR